MVKAITLKYLDPKEALRLVQESGILPYLINWGCHIDETNHRLVFQLKHGGGGFEDEVKNAASELESFLKSVDVKS